MFEPGDDLDLGAQAHALIDGERDVTAVLANLSSLIFYTLPDLNWAGFYLYKDGELVLGPFQGRVACYRIALDRGVCGAAARTLTTQRVADVHEFPGHIACDSASNAELVIPLQVGGTLFGVLDLDSPLPGRFSEADEQLMERVVRVLEDHLASVMVN
ncbi:MAG: GAF domain-containing protein [Gammaproteobacteria bacterium]|nr:GAF domain-containing protein [Gammaproteobacteria bacterium]